MSTHREAVRNDQPYSDPNPMPKSVPHVDELGTTSAPLKSASFFIGDYCKEYNGKCQRAALRTDRDKEGMRQRDGTTCLLQSSQRRNASGHRLDLHQRHV